MTFNEFHNGLRILVNIDRHELVDAGIIQKGDHNAWGTFTRNPFLWFIKADDSDAQKLWALMQKRMSRV